MKKIVVVAIFLFTLAVSAFAQYDSESDFEIRRDPNNPNDGVVIYEYLGSKTTVNIPPKIENLPVISIGYKAFSDRNSITSITMPNGITSIDREAFGNCTSLTSINIPESVTSIGLAAFRGCKSLTSINIPYGVKKIDIETFNRCSSLTNVTIPNSVTSIGNIAFYYCNSLVSITIPNSVTNIGPNAFDHTSLTSVTFQGTIPSSGFSSQQGDNLKDVRTLFYATDKSKGTPGTYTRPSSTSKIWTKQ